MSKIRRSLGRYIAPAAFSLLAACAFQPSQAPGPQPVSPTVLRTEPTEDTLGTLLGTLPDTSEQAVKISESHSQDYPLVHALAERFNKPEMLIQRVVNAATHFAGDNFPLRNDILAIIAVESGFNTKASYKGSKGLMQVQLSSHRKDLAGKDPYNVEDNISVGSDILRGYYVALNGNERAAVLAYNSGIGSYEHRHYKSVYYRKYLKELNFIQSIDT